MGGGLMQLVAYGAQDIYLTGNPQITFFKVVYRRHTNFAIESIENTFSGDADFGKKINVTIARNGDLLGAVTLEADLNITLDSIDENGDEIGNMKYSSKTDDFSGWLKCDGRFLDKRQYKRLFQKIGYSFGSDTTDSNLFRIPDAQSKVLAVPGSSATITQDIISVNTGSNTLSLGTTTYNFSTGTKVKVYGSPVPNPLVNGNTYYIINVNATTIKLASTLEDALNNSEIDITTTGTSVYFEYTLQDRNLGEITGSDTHKLTIAEMPIHNHTINDPSHNHGVTDPSHNHGITDPGHNHSYVSNVFDQDVHTLTTQEIAADQVDVASTTGTSVTGISINNNTTGVTVNNNTTGITINNTGGDLLHTIVQPTIFAGNLFICATYSSDITIINKYLKEHLIRWGFQLLDMVEIEIGGQLIDRHYGEWMDIWCQLTYSAEKYQELLTMINCSIINNDFPGNTIAKVYVPLQFWFCRNSGLYLPLIALQYHEVKINITFNSKSTVNTATEYTSNSVKIENFDYTTGSYDKSNFINSIEDFKIFCDYVFLDTDERRRFAQVSHEYLIEQVQTSGIVSHTNSSVAIPLYFNHPCKAIVWRGQRNNFTFSDNSIAYPYDEQFFLGNLYDFTTIGGNSSIEGAEFRFTSDVVKSVKLQMNGLDRFKEREGSYFRVVQPNQFTSAVGGATSLYHNGLKRFGGGFYVYNFGLKIDEHQPSGTCNFSRIDNASLFLQINPYATNELSAPKSYEYQYRAYAVNYNVLRIMSGMGGLAYSN